MREILNKENKKAAIQNFEYAMNLGINFKLNTDVKKKNFNQEKLDSLLQMPMKGTEVSELLKEFEHEILPFCSNFSSEKFMGFPDAGNSISGICGAIISDFLQQNLINSSFCAPIATYLEISVIKWLRELLGYKIDEINSIWDVGGIITYGGTGSNATALLLARENFRQGTMKNGVMNPSDYKVIIPKGIGHYSIKSSLMWIGCGDQIIEVETKNYKYDLSKLQQALDENKGKVMCVVCYVGDSRTMTIENLNEVYRMVKASDEKIWLHADACHGFSLAFSEKLKEKISGIENFDSISTDPHKVLAIPYCISALLVKNPEKFKLITSTSDLIMQEDYAFGQITPFIGSKSWVSLKLWFMIKNFGITQIGKMIEKRMEMAQYLKNKIIQNKHFYLLNSVDMNSVVFMYTNDKFKQIKDINELNKLNEKIYNFLLDEGKYYLHKFSLNDDSGIILKNAMLTPLRYMSGNDNISHMQIDDMLEHVIAVGKKMSS